MLIFGYDIHNNIIYGVLFILICLIICFIIGLIISYIIFNNLSNNMDCFGIFMHKFDKKSMDILDKYGDYSINKIYLVRMPPIKLTSTLLNILTFYKYDHYIKQSTDYLPYHIQMIVELKIKDKLKFILIDKSQRVSISEVFLMNTNYDILPLSFKKKKNADGKHTLNKIIKDTISRIGTRNFFNWDLVNNNCQQFIVEFLDTSGKLTNNTKEFVNRNIMLYKVCSSPTDFSIKLINSCVLLNNICEKYIFNKIFAS